MKRILLLAGTTEARAIASGLKDQTNLNVIASFTGATQAPANLGVEARVGGFGGSDGLANFIDDRKIDLLVDATHPFAATMKAHAAAQIVPTVHVIRPAWRAGSGDDWVSCKNMNDAAARLPADAKAFLALGQRHISAFAAHPAAIWVRSVDPPAEPGHFNWITAGPTDGATEADQFRALGITHLVCRNSGGATGWGKIEAARRLGLTVLMIERPIPPKGDIVTTPGQAVEFCLRHAGP